MIGRMKRRGWLFLLLFLLGISLGVGYGLLASRLRLPPYTLFMKAYISLVVKVQSDSDGVNLPFQNQSNLGQIKTPDDLVRLRRQLTLTLWGTDELPVSTALEHYKKVDASQYAHIRNLDRIDELVVMMDYDLDSRLYLFWPVDSINSLVVYHQGHEGGFVEGKKTIEELLNAGHTVLAASMPLLGMNSKPVVEFKGVGKSRVVEHNQIQFLETSGSPLKYFIEPVVRSLNYLTERSEFESVSMVGISGGGWTTTIVAALDSRIKTSVSVAGTEPLVLSDKMPTEYEQVAPELYGLVNYPSLYILSATGADRKHIQIHNKYDPCCYRGQTAPIYEKVLSDIVESIDDGEFKVMIDSTHAEHKISQYAVEYILNELSDD